MEFSALTKDAKGQAVWYPIPDKELDPHLKEVQAEQKEKELKEAKELKENINR